MADEKKTKKIKYKPLSEKGTDRLYHILFWPFFVILSIFHPVRVVGKENIPAGAAVITPNHSSNFDPPMAIMAFGAKYPLRIMAKEELFFIPFLGFIMVKCGMFAVKRGQADMAAIKHAIRVLKNNCKLMLFPEGTRVTSDDTATSAKTGAIMFASRGQAPLVPVYIPRKKKWFRPTTVIIGEPYYPDVPKKGATQEDYQREADELLRRIYALGEESK